MSRSTWYYNMNALKQGDRYAGLKENIRKIYHYHKGRYGYRRITLALRKQGLRINHKTVQRLMAELSLRSVIRAKKYRARKGRTGEAAPNILSRNFGASKANEKWVTDVTEFPVQGKKLYLSSVLDLFNREVIAYSLSERPVMEMVNTMLDGAFPKLRPGDAPLLHSDQGWHYRMRSYQERLKAHGMTQSMSRKGNCLDNAVMENFFGPPEIGVFLSEGVQECQCAKKSRRGLYPLLQQRADKPEIKRPESGRVPNPGSESRLI